MKRWWKSAYIHKHDNDLGASVLKCATIYQKGNCIQVNTKHPAIELQFLYVLQMGFKNKYIKTKLLPGVQSKVYVTLKI